MRKVLSIVVIAVSASACGGLVGGGDSSSTAPTTGPTPIAAPAPAPPPPPPAAITFTGIWRGRVTTSSCSDDGVFDDICGEIPTQNVSIVINLIQTGANVTGTVDAGGLAVRVTGTANGNRLVISGRDRLSPNIDLGYEDWTSTIQGSSMSGGHTLRFYPAQNGVRGGVSWKQTLVEVVKAS